MAHHIIAIAGGTGSGKSTLADKLSSHLSATILRIDDYYRPLNHLTFEERERVNFDSPEAIDHILLLEHLDLLTRGKSVEKPIYDFSKHTRAFVGATVEPAKFIIVEGLFALYWPELNEICDTRIFVETPKQTRFERRLKRDIEERGRDADEVTFRFHNHVNPMHELYVAPCRSKSTLTVSGEDALTLSTARAMALIEAQSAHLRASLV